MDLIIKGCHFIFLKLFSLAAFSWLCQNIQGNVFGLNLDAIIPLFSSIIDTISLLVSASTCYYYYHQDLADQESDN